MRDVFNEMETIREIMESAFNGALPGMHQMHPKVVSKRNYPACTPARSALANVRETGESVLARFEIPGVDKKDIELNIKDDSIEVKAFKTFENQAKDKKCETKSCKSVKFYKAIGLPASVNPDKATASYKDGVLRVEMPKIEANKSKKIEIQ